MTVEWSRYETTLIDLWRAGKSAGKIAEALSEECGARVSRSAVCGHIRYLRAKAAKSGEEISLRENSAPSDRFYTPPPPPRPQKRKEPKKATKPEPHFVRRADAAPDNATVETGDDIKELFPAAAALLSLDSRQCRYMVADDRFCAAETAAPGVPYCAEHMRLAYTQARE